MNEEIFTVENLKSGLGGNLFDTLSNHAIDAGANFLNGKVTSAFTKINESEEAKNITGLLIAGGAAHQTLINALDPETIKSITEGIVGESLSIISNRVGVAIGQAADKITDKIVDAPTYVARVAQTYFMTYKKSLNELMNDMMTTADKKFAEERKQRDKNKLSYMISKSKEKVAKFAKDASYYSYIATEKINMVISYIENGPEWVSNEVNKHLNNVLTATTYNIDKQASNITYAISMKCENIGNEMGQTFVDEYNLKIEQLAEKKINKLRNMRRAATIKAETIKAESVLKIMSKTGINLPTSLKL